MMPPSLLLLLHLGLRAGAGAAQARRIGGASAGAPRSRLWDTLVARQNPNRQILPGDASPAMPSSLLMDSSLASSFARKGTRRRDKDTRQDFDIYYLWSTKKYVENEIEWMDANADVLDEQLKAFKKDVDNNQTYVKDFQKEQFDKWQSLANSLVWTIRGYIDSHKEYKDRVAKKQKNTFKAVATLLKYLQDGFGKSIKTLNEYKGKVAAAAKTSLEQYNTAILKAAKVMRTGNLKGKRGVKIVKKKMGKNLMAEDKKMKRLFSALERHMKALHHKAKMTIEANVRMGQQLTDQMKKADEDMYETTGKFKSHYASIVKRAKDIMGTKRTDYGVLSEKLAGQLEEDLVKAQKEIAAGAERALKRLDRMKQESVARTADLGTDAKENLTGLSDQVAEKSELYTETLGEVREEIAASAAVQKEFSAERDARVTELKTGYAKQKDDMSSMSTSMKEDMAAGFGGLEHQLRTDFEDINDLATKELPEQQEARVQKMEDTIKKGMGDVVKTHEEGTRAASGWLGHIRADNAKGFEKAGKRLLSLEGELQGEEQAVGAWESTSARALGAMDKDISASTRSLNESISGNSAELSAAIAGMAEKGKADAARLSATVAGLSADSAAQMSRGLTGAEKTLDTEANAIMREEAMLKKTQNAQRAFAQSANGRNKDGAAALSDHLGNLAEEERAARALVEQSRRGMQATVTSTGVQVRDWTRKLQRTAEQELGTALDTDQLSFGRALEADAAHMDSRLAGQQASVGAASKTLDEDLARVARGQTASDAALSKLSKAVAAVNADSSAEFAQVQNYLSAESIQDAKTDADLEKQFEKKALAVEKLFKSKIARMSAVDQEQYEEEVQKEMAEMKAVLANNSMSFAEKQQHMAKMNSRLSFAFEEMAEEARIDEQELQRINQELELTRSTTKRVVADGLQSVSAGELAAEQSEEALKKKLDARTESIRRELTANGVKLKGGLGGRVNQVMHAANMRIGAIAQNATLSGEEKQALIERIDRATKDRIAGLQHAEAALAQGLTTFEEEEVSFDGSVEQKLAQLDTQLKDGQMAVVKHALQEKQMLEDQVNQLTGLVDNLLGQVRRANESETAQLSDAEQTVLLALEKTTSGIKAAAAERDAEASQTLHEVQLAQTRLDTARAADDQQLAAIGSRISALDTDASGSGSFREQVRQTAKNSAATAALEEGFVKRTGKSLLDNLAFITETLAQIADSSHTRDAAIDTKLAALARAIAGMGGQANATAGTAAASFAETAGLGRVKARLARQEAAVARAEARNQELLRLVQARRGQP